MRICLDANVLIWGIRGVATPGQEEMVRYAKRAFQRMGNENVEIAIPTPVMSEYLVPSDSATRENEINVLQKRFQILPFDGRAASEAAVLAKACRTKNTDFDGGRTAIKFDTMIIACAIVHECDCVLTFNTAEMNGISRGRMVIQCLQQFVDSPSASILPVTTRQLDLDMEEIFSSSPTE